MACTQASLNGNDLLLGREIQSKVESQNPNTRVTKNHSQHIVMFPLNTVTGVRLMKLTEPVIDFSLLKSTSFLDFFFRYLSSLALNFINLSTFKYYSEFVQLSISWWRRNVQDKLNTIFI